MVTGPALTPRERFRLTLAHQSVDRPPMDLAATDMTEIAGGPRRLAVDLGIPMTCDRGADDQAVLDALEIDIRGVGGVLSPESPLARQDSPTEFTDCWGVGRRFDMGEWQIVHRPLEGATLADLDRYAWPQADRIPQAVIDGAAERARYLYEQTPWVVCARHPVLGVLELGCWMCGFDDFLARLACDQEFVHRFFGIVLDYQKRVIDRYYSALGRWIHFTSSGDDFGAQAAPMLSPAMFGKLVAPYMADRIRATRRHTDAAFFHHTCGAVRPLVPQLVAMGVDILNPIQPRAAGMEPEGLKRDFGDQLTFHGGIDTQQLLPNGTADEVREEVRRVTRILSSDGGYILAPAHVLLDEVPNENVLALYTANR